MSKIFKEELIYDDDVIKGISFLTLAYYEGVLKELEEINERKYTCRAGKIIEGPALKKLIKEINIEKELLEYLLKKADKYRIS